MNKMNKLNGAQIQTKDSFLWGRFETMCRPGTGSGVITGFFLFDDSAGFQNNWSEIDIEILGRYTNEIQSNVIRTINKKKVNNEGKHVLAKRSADTFIKLGVEWVPDGVRWSINDVVVRVLTIALSKPMKLMVNIWASPDKNWAGEIHTGLLPQQAEYKYLRITPYIKGKFIGEKAVQYEFDKLDLNVFQIGTHVLGDTVLVKENVSVKDGSLILKLN